MKDIINQKSKDADLVMIGFRKEAIKQLGDTLFEGYDEVGNILFLILPGKKQSISFSALMLSWA
jgi:hypothetical protein